MTTAIITYLQMSKYKKACDGGQLDLKKKSKARFGFTQNPMGLPESMTVLHAATNAARFFYKHIGKAERLGKHVINEDRG